MDDNLDELLEEDELESPRRRDRRLSSSSEKSSLSHFGPRQVCYVIHVEFFLVVKIPIFNWFLLFRVVFSRGY